MKEGRKTSVMKMWWLPDLIVAYSLPFCNGVGPRQEEDNFLFVVGRQMRGCVCNRC